MLDALRGISRFKWVRNGLVESTDDDDHIDLLLDIGALDIKERLEVQKGGCVVLTEDAFAKPIETLVEACGFDMGMTQTLSYGGCTEPHNLRPLIKVIRDRCPKVNVLVHRDRDFLTEAEADEWEKDIRALGAEPFLTKDVCLESYFLHPDHINHLDPAVDITSCQAMVDRARLATRDDSVKKQVNNRIDIQRKRKNSGTLDVGQLAIEAPRSFDRDPRRFADAKVVLRKLRTMWQAEFKRNLKTDAVSPYLLDSNLLGVAKKFFGRVDVCPGAGSSVEEQKQDGANAKTQIDDSQPLLKLDPLPPQG